MVPTMEENRTAEEAADYKTDLSTVMEDQRIHDIESATSDRAATSL